jgi:hypothetical protein
MHKTEHIIAGLFSGVANQGDICFLKKQSLIQDTFGEDVALTAAHEIGHK